MSNEVEKNGGATVEIVPLGTDEKIKLSVSIVQRLIAVKTKSGKLPDTDQCLKFMALCKAKHLNPFEGDCYLLGYDSQGGAQFSQITAHQVFLKRAEASEGFDGMQSGVIVYVTNEGVMEREGDLLYDDEKLLGGWAKVYRKDRTHPFYKRLKLETFNTGQSRWAKDPAGMIVKCAEADALRTAFPTHLGGLYMKEEREPIDVVGETIPRPTFAPLPPAEVKPDKPKKGRKKEPADSLPSALDQIRRHLEKDGFTEDDLVTVANQLHWADVWKLDEVDDERLLKWIANWEEIKTQLSDYKAVQVAEQKKPEQQQDALFK